MKTIAQKKELIDWLSTVDDELILNEISNIKRQSTFDFEEELKTAISGEELKRRTTEYIESLPWKKQLFL
jgi:hypothetical protein